MKKYILLIGFTILSAIVMAQSQPLADNSGDKVIIYPDQSGNIINIEITDKSEQVSFQVYTTGGTNVSNKVRFLSHDPYNKKMDVTKLKPGTYLIWYHTSDAYHSVKLVKS